MNKHELILMIAKDANISEEEAKQALKNFELCMEEDNYSIVLQSNSDDCVVEYEPLWVRNQQNKTFKRGKQ